MYESSDQRASSASEVQKQVQSFAAALMKSPNRNVLVLLVVGLVIVIVATAGAQLQLNAWNKPFFAAIERRDLGEFFSQIAIFGLIAGSLLVLNVGLTWLDRLMKLQLRQWLTRDLLSEWLAPQRASMISGLADIGDKPDQRIHEDAQRLAELSTALGVGLFQSLVMLVGFVGVLWILSQGLVLEFAGRRFVVPGFMVWCALAYAFSGSLLSWAVGRPLVRLGVTRSAREADLRFALVRVSEFSDGIALYGGEADERRNLERELQRVTAVLRQSATAIARLTWITAGYGWSAIVVPFLIAAPGYFGGHLTFGELMMTIGAFNQVHAALRWFVDNAGGIADWRASLTRIKSFRQGLLDVAKEHAHRPKLRYIEDSPTLVFDNVVVRVGNQDIRLDQDRVEVAPGERILIIGKPGIEKSTFFRAIAGLWPWGTGTLQVPRRASMMFFPQRIYVPTGSLRQALTYPRAPSEFPEADLVHALKRTRLEHLIPALDHEERWDKRLSNDELLHLDIARKLIHKPLWIIGDEAVSQLNEEDRRLVFSLFDAKASNPAVVSLTSSNAETSFYSRTFRLISSPAEAEIASHTSE